MYMFTRPFIHTYTWQIRRLKKEVLQQLPPKRRFIHRIQIEDTEIKTRLKSLYESIQSKSKLLISTSYSKNCEDKSVRSDVWLARKSMLMEVFICIR